MGFAGGQDKTFPELQGTAQIQRVPTLLSLPILGYKFPSARVKACNAVSPTPPTVSIWPLNASTVIEPDILEIT